LVDGCIIALLVRGCCGIIELRLMHYGNRNSIKPVERPQVASIALATFFTLLHNLYLLFLVRKMLPSFTCTVFIG